MNEMLVGCYFNSLDDGIALARFGIYTGVIDTKGNFNNLYPRLTADGVGWTTKCH